MDACRDGADDHEHLVIAVRVRKQFGDRHLRSFGTTENHATIAYWLWLVDLFSKKRQQHVGVGKSGKGLGGAVWRRGWERRSAREESRRGMWTVQNGVDVV